MEAVRKDLGTFTPDNIFAVDSNMFASLWKIYRVLGNNERYEASGLRGLLRAIEAADQVAGIMA